MAVPPLDNRLSFTDQLLFLGQRATGQELVMQAVWVYEHPVDFDGLRRFHDSFGYGLFGRRIERSPLPFGRHRWVSSLGPASDLDVAGTSRPRAELSDWIDERAQLPIDPEWGPGWHLGILPMTDGSTAVSLVLSHCLSDGLGSLQTIVDAVKGTRRNFGYPRPHSRTRLRAVAADLRQTARDTPEVARTVVLAAKQGFRRRHEIARSGPKRSAATPKDTGNVVMPAITIYIDLDDWDARANSLGGTSYSLVAGFAAKLAERIGRRRASDGAVTLHIPISDRTPDDTRANAASLANVSFDPTEVTTDLSGARVAIKQSLTMLQEAPDETLQLLPLTPFLPKRVVKRGANVVFGFDDSPVSCSNLGDVDPVVARVDGTDAEYVMLRGVDRHVTREFLERRGGLLTVLAGRIGGRISITVVAYRPGSGHTGRVRPHRRDRLAGQTWQFRLVRAAGGLTGVNPKMIQRWTIGCRSWIKPVFTCCARRGAGNSCRWCGYTNIPSTSTGSSAFTGISDTDWRADALSGLRCRSAGIGGSRRWVRPPTSSSSSRGPVPRSATGPTNKRKYPSIRSGGLVGISASCR
jgi:hypothetical protein